MAPDPAIPGLLDLLVETSPGDRGGTTAQPRFVAVAVRGADGLGDGGLRDDGGPRPHARDWVEVSAEATR
ncbi:MAG TPA: hypothetical protein VGO64_07460 [Candidatus Limnocylindrales bacterium]|jgi:hypothetical protein|nr:hypothetical protein [Candidatus Limnocylindrales bacterium]